MNQSSGGNKVIHCGWCGKVGRVCGARVCDKSIWCEPISTYRFSTYLSSFIISNLNIHRPSRPPTTHRVGVFFPISRDYISIGCALLIPYPPTKAKRNPASRPIPTHRLILFPCVYVVGVINNWGYLWLSYGPIPCILQCECRSLLHYAKNNLNDDRLLGADGP